MRTHPIVLICLPLAACGSTPGHGSSTPPGTATEASAPAESPFVVESGSLAAAIAGEHRSEANRARDGHRHPAETLSFFGLEPGMTVVELWPGAGWYTEILAPTLRDHGKLVAAIPGTEGRRARYANQYREFLAAHPELYDQVGTVALDPPTDLELGPPGSADLVVTFRNTHNWLQDEVAEAVYQAAFRVLKPGGTFGVVQHRGVEGVDPAESAKQGYVPEAHVIEIAQRVGFELEEKSELNANPNDTKDHEGGVWALPPSLRNEDQDRARFVAIGESDRMTLRFRKPATE